MSLKTEVFSAEWLKKTGSRISRPLLGALTASLFTLMVSSNPAFAQANDRFPHSTEAIRTDLTDSRSSRPADEVTRIRLDIDTRSVPSILRTLVIAGDSLNRDLHSSKSESAAE